MKNFHLQRNEQFINLNYENEQKNGKKLEHYENCVYGVILDEKLLFIKNDKSFLTLLVGLLCKKEKFLFTQCYYLFILFMVLITFNIIYFSFRFYILYTNSGFIIILIEKLTSKGNVIYTFEFVVSFTKWLHFTPVSYIKSYVFKSLWCDWFVFYLANCLCLFNE